MKLPLRALSVFKLRASAGAACQYVDFKQIFSTPVPAGFGVWCGDVRHLSNSVTSTVINLYARHFIPPDFAWLTIVAILKADVPSAGNQRRPQRQLVANSSARDGVHA